LLCSVVVAVIVRVFALQDGRTALLWACYMGDVKVVEWLVTEASCDARSERDNVRAVSLSLAVAVFAHLLLAMTQDGSSALLLACEHGHVDVARWLVANAGSDAASERDKVDWATRPCDGRVSAMHG
jgi:ankyrin repeat protein